MARSNFNELKGVFKTLHGPKGCLWDKKQTHQSLISDLKEEVEEFIETVNKDDPEHMKEELGDLLLHVMFNAQIASKNKQFDIEDVIEGLIKKLKRRHPHVFGDTKVKSANQIIRNWNKIKRLEKRSKLRKI
jgi:tetrapyrrole methylase family protein / MazG family protein